MRSSLMNGNSSGRYFDRFSRAFFTYSLVTPICDARASVSFQRFFASSSMGVTNWKMASLYWPSTRPQSSGFGLARLLGQLLQLVGRIVGRLDQLLGELVVDVAGAQERRQRPGGVLVVPDLLVVLVQLLGLGGERVEGLLDLVGLAAELELLLLEGLELLLHDEEVGLGGEPGRRRGRAAACGRRTRRGPACRRPRPPSCSCSSAP